MWKFRQAPEERAVEITDLPPINTGAPLPTLLVTEGRTILVYLVQEPPEGWDGKSVRSVDPASEDETVAVVTFDGCAAQVLGPPNDEALAGHRLYKKGLTFYGAHRVENSAWMQRLERINRVHPQYSSGRYDDHAHYVLTFHDSTFGCVAKGHRSEVVKGSIKRVLAELTREIA